VDAMFDSLGEREVQGASQGYYLTAKEWKNEQSSHLLQISFQHPSLRTGTFPLGGVAKVVQVASELFAIPRTLPCLSVSPPARWRTFTRSSGFSHCGLRQVRSGTGGKAAQKQPVFTPYGATLFNLAHRNKELVSA